MENFNQKVSNTLEENIINLCKKAKCDYDNGRAHEYRTCMDSVEKLLQAYHEQTFSSLDRDECTPRLGMTNQNFYNQIIYFIEGEFDKINTMFNTTLTNSNEPDNRHSVAIINTLLSLHRKLKRYYKDIDFSIDRYLQRNQIQTNIIGSNHIEINSVKEYIFEISNSNGKLNEKNYELEWSIEFTEGNHLDYKIDILKSNSCSLRVRDYAEISFEPKNVILLVKDKVTGAHGRMKINVNK